MLYRVNRPKFEAKWIDFEFHEVAKVESCSFNSYLVSLIKTSRKKNFTCVPKSLQTNLIKWVSVN